MADFTVAWVSKGGSTITRPSGTFYRATAAAAGNLEASSSGTVTVAPGEWDITFTVKRAAGPARSGDLFLNVLNSGGGYLTTLFAGSLPGTSDTSTAVTKRFTIPANGARVTIEPSYYSAGTGDAIDLEPTVSATAATVEPPPPATTTGTTGWYVAGTPLVPVRLTVA